MHQWTLPIIRQMRKIKFINFIALAALTMGLFSSPTCFAQGEKFIGEWVITPAAPSNIISHLTISKKGNGFEISRTQEPDDRWSALFDKKSLKMVAIIDGKMVYFTYDNKNGLLNLFDYESDKKICELRKE
jgi:hypothetical protein